MTDLQSITQEDDASSVFLRLVTILFLALMGTFVASLLVQGLSQFMGMDYLETISNLKENASNKEKNFIKSALNISHLCTFILPSLIFLWWTYGKNWKKSVHLSKAPSWTNSLLAGLLLLFNLLTIAVLPAIGEELLFRGIIQTNLEKGFKKPHLAIWLTALIFSFIHFQFQGFIPRVLLGALLGYLFLWSRNLWVPIIAHLIYNASQIFLQYAHQKGALGMDLNEIETVPIWLVVLSIAGMFIVGRFLYSQRVEISQKISYTDKLGG